MEGTQGRRVVIVGAGPLSMHLAKELLLRGHEVGIATLRGFRDALHFLQIPGFVNDLMERKARPNIYVATGDVRHLQNVQSWFTDGVPDVVHMMTRVSDEVTTGEISTRLDGILNLQAATDSTHRKTHVYIHQEGTRDILRKSLQDMEALYAVEHPRMQLLRYSAVSAPGNTRVLKFSLDHLLYAVKTRDYKATDFPDTILATVLSKWLARMVDLTEKPGIPTNKGVDAKHRPEAQALINLTPDAVKVQDVIGYLCAADPAFSAVLGTTPVVETVDTLLRDSIMQYYDSLEDPSKAEGKTPESPVVTPEKSKIITP